MDLNMYSNIQKDKWPTPAESIGLKTKTKTKKKYIHSKISRSHRNPKKAISDLGDILEKKLNNLMLLSEEEIKNQKLEKYTKLHEF